MSRGHLPVDLHLHSTASDGSLSPARLIEKASAAGLAAAALTDHDTLDGVKEALEAGRRCGLEVLPGVEISVQAGEQEIHLLGYDPLFPEKISAFLEEMRRERYRRMQQMTARLRRLGFSISDDEIIAEAGPGAPGRLHLARLMVKRGYSSEIDEAFSDYLERGRPAFVPRKIPDPATAIRMLHRAGAVPVVAHPGASGKALLRKLVAMGLRGVEVFHPEHSPEMIRHYRHQALQMNLLITGGSDFHGDRDHRTGRLGGITVPYRYLAALKEAPRGF